MTRAIYRTLLRLLPPSFRSEYGGEMLWIFDQTSGAKAGLLLDLARSIVRQATACTVLWHCVAAVGIGALPYLLGAWAWQELNGWVTTARPVTYQAALLMAGISTVVTIFLVSLCSAVWFIRAGRPKPKARAAR